MAPGPRGRDASAGSLSAADYNIVTYGAKEGGARCSIPTPYSS